MKRGRIIQAIKKLHTKLIENNIDTSELALIDDLLKWYEQHLIIQIILISHKEALKAALKWWDEEASSLTESVGDEEWDNVFDGDPEWVRDARRILDNK